MPNQPWWQPIVQHAVWVVLMSLVMGWVAKSRLKSRPKAPAGLMVYPVSMLIIGVVCVVVFLALAVLCWLFPGKSGSPIIVAFFGGFALLGVPLILEYVRVQFRLEPEGLRYQTLSGRRGVLAWSQIAAVRYSQAAKWFRLDGKRGELIRISSMIIGLPQFAQVILAMAPQAQIDVDTRRVLQATAAGSPPSIWG